jgi:type IV fimbrial biogenesis protein FimT
MTTQHNKQGFTLIELLVVIAIAAILATIAAPSFVDMTKNSRLNTAAREFQSIIQLARTEAITRNQRVNIYNVNADDDWSDDIYLCQAASAATVCVANNANFIKKYTIGDLTDDGISNSDISINSSATGASIISITSTGQTNAQITIAFCDNRTDGNRDYQLLSVAATGRPSVIDLGVGGTCEQ